MSDAMIDDKNDNNEKNESQPQRLNMLPALLSLFCPGLGQLVQNRAGSAVGFFLLFVLTGFLPVLIVSLLFVDRFSHQSSRIHVIHILVFLGVCVPLMLAFFYSVMDAAVWKPGDRTRFQPPLIVGGAIFFVILVLLLLPAVPSAREAARRMSCTNNLKQISLAFHTYHDAYHCFPPAYTVGENGKPLHSWRVLILPYIEQGTLYEQIRLDEPWDSEYNRKFHDVSIYGFCCPSAGLHERIRREMPNLIIDGNCYYSIVVGPEAIFHGSKAVPMGSISDGTSNTILVVERLLPVCWMDPNSEISFDVACKGINSNIYGIGSAHTGGANAAAADGSVQFISDTIKPETLRAYLTKAGGESVIW